MNLSIQDLEAAATQDRADEEGEAGRRGQEKNQQASSCSPEGQEILKILMKTISRSCICCNLSLKTIHDLKKCL